MEGTSFYVGAQRGGNLDLARSAVEGVLLMLIWWACSHVGGCSLREHACNLRQCDGGLRGVCSRCKLGGTSCWRAREGLCMVLGGNFVGNSGGLQGFPYPMGLFDGLRSVS